MLVPRTVFKILILSCLAAISIIVLLATRLPWIGLELTASNQNILQVERVYPGSAYGKLKVGDNIRYIKSNNGSLIIPVAYTTLISPVHLPTYSLYNDFFIRYRKLYQHYQKGSIVFELENGTQHNIKPSASRPIQYLPLKFWLLNGFGVIAVLIGGSIWSYKRQHTCTLLFFLSGIAYAVTTATISIYGIRELIIEPGIFEFLVLLNRFATFSFAYLMAALFWIYPSRLGSQKCIWLILSNILLFWFNQYYQIIEWPFHTFSTVMLIPVVLGVYLAAKQWKNTKNKPIERAALKWIVLAIQLLLFIVVLVWSIPQIFEIELLMSLTSANAVVLIVFIGIALGVVRYQLFNLDRWGFETWILMFGGILILGFDIALVTILQFNQLFALTVSILIAGWVYFPIRQYIWARIVKPSSTTLEDCFVEIMSVVISSESTKHFSEHWPVILKRIFKPLKLDIVAYEHDRIEIANNGLILRVPDLENNTCIELSYANQGTRLFAPKDINTGQAMLALAKKSLSLHEARQQGVDEERVRIMNDLHDDVAPTIMSAIHKTKNQELSRVLQSTMHSLRGTIYSLKNNSSDKFIFLADALINWRVEVTNQIESENKELSWFHSDDLDQHRLAIRNYINIGRIIREAVTNSIKHGASKFISVSIFLVNREIIITICDDNKFPIIGDWVEGVGIASMKKRAQQMNATVDWSQGGLHLAGVCVIFRYTLI